MSGTAPTTPGARPSGGLALIDWGIYQAERAAGGFLFLTMSLVMFANVLERVFSRDESRLVTLVFGKLPTPENEWWHHSFSLYLNLGLTFLVSLLGVRTMKRSGPPQPFVMSLGLAAAITALLAGFVWVVLDQFPNGLVWAPRVSGVCMLCVGLVGASIATYEKRHLALEMGDKLWRASIAHFVKSLSFLTAVAMCLFLAWLSWKSILDYKVHGDVVDPSSLPWAKWKVLLIVPFSLCMMALRFLGLAVRVIFNPEAGASGELIPGMPTGDDAGSESQGEAR